MGLSWVLMEEVPKKRGGRGKEGRGEVIGSFGGKGIVPSLLLGKRPKKQLPLGDPRCLVVAYGKWSGHLGKDQTPWHKRL